jgi:hypothetical protein
VPVPQFVVLVDQPLHQWLRLACHLLQQLPLAPACNCAGPTKGPTAQILLT